MKPSPIGSKLLSVYAILFAGFVPAALVTTAFVNGVVSLPLALGYIALGVAIVFFGVRVFAGDYSATKVFAILVVLNYLGLTAVNAWNISNVPEDNRAAQMAVPRMIRGMIRGVLFASVYIWYYLIRKQTALGFVAATGSAIQPTMGKQLAANNGNSFAQPDLPAETSVSAYCTACKKSVEIDKFDSRCPLCGWPI